MAQFFKFVFASMLGTFFALVVGTLLFFAVVVGIISASSNKKSIQVGENSILMLNLDYEIPERSPVTPFGDYDYKNFQTKTIIGLNDILIGIKRAKEDPKIKGIYINTTEVGAGYANTEEIRNALIDFRQSTKFIVAYSEVYSRKAYYLASVANEIYLNPEGVLELNGMSQQTFFLKGLLSKLNIEAQIIKVGTYKSAVEPLILDKMSDANRAQVTSFLGSIYDQYIDQIGKARNIPNDSLRRMANELLIHKAEDALAYHLVDSLIYKDEVIALLKQRTNVDANKDLNVINIKNYNGSLTQEAETTLTGDQIAVVYAGGDIITGEGKDDNIGSERISRTIRELREDHKVKAIVMRINSPGGSALASDVIWREMELAKKVKPVVVSMGDYAASGGYYIACSANTIYAQPTTITGSIGVFAIIPNVQGLLQNKLGINVDGVKTSEFADMGSPYRPLSAAEKVYLQNDVNHIYDTFTKKVADGRNQSQRAIDSIGQGRVWTGSQGIENGLVDKLGGLSDAIADAAKQAKVTSYRTVDYPSQNTILESLFKDVTDDIQTYFVKQELGEHYPLYEKIKKMTDLKGIQARIPFEFMLEN